jgi:hypothetical protein
MKKTVLFQLAGSAAALALFASLSAGCGSPGRPRDLMMEEARAGTVERPVAMKGEGTFLDGKLAAVATVSRGFDRGVRGQRSDIRAEEGGRRSRRDENPFTEVYSISGDSEEEQKEAIKEYIRQAMALRAAGSPMPPVTLRVEFENRTTEPLEVEVTEVNSYLGNFAVRPPRLSLAPGEKGVLEPMISQLGVTSDEIPLKLEVRYAGRRESQVVPVKNILTDSLRKEFDRLQP